MRCYCCRRTPATIIYAALPRAGVKREREVKRDSWTGTWRGSRTLSLTLSLPLSVVLAAAARGKLQEIISSRDQFLTVPRGEKLAARTRCKRNDNTAAVRARKGRAVKRRRKNEALQPPANDHSAIFHFMIAFFRVKRASTSWELRCVHIEANSLEGTTTTEERERERKRKDRNKTTLRERTERDRSPRRNSQKRSFNSCKSARFLSPSECVCASVCLSRALCVHTNAERVYTYICVYMYNTGERGTYIISSTA